MATILLLSTADTELLAARAAGAGYRTANPARTDPADLPGLLDGADVAVVRLLGGREAWPRGLDALRASGVPLVALGGEAAPDAELLALSTVPSGVATEAHGYLREGGVGNLRELARFLSDTVLLTGEGFEPPRPMPEYGTRGTPAAHPGRPTVAVVFYRAHELSGNTAFVDTLCAAIEAAGGAPLPVFTGSLRGVSRDTHSGLFELLDRADAVITTVLAAGGAVAADASGGGDEDAWDAGALAALDVPVLQGLVLTSSRAAWAASDAALTPMDAGMQVAIPEFDGRIVTVPFSFKELDPATGVPVYAADPERCARLAGIAVRHARLRAIPPAGRRLAVVLSSYPTKHSRVGNAVGLDTPASAVRLFRRLAEHGYDLGPDDRLWRPPAPEEGRRADDGDPLIHALIAAGGHDVEWLTAEQLAQAPARVPLDDYQRWFDALPAPLRDGIREHWGEPPGELYTDDSAGRPEIVLACLRFGNVVLMIQPPRGFGENPIAIYHDPDLPPSHHYLAAYRWLETAREAGGFGADAVVHLGKHGTLEWLPGKGLGLAAEDAPDAVLGDLPLVYPFIVNDPGEGTQAKRRGHATVVDHLVPPMARADTYGDIARLEQLLDEYALVSDLDPDKAPALRAQIWTLVKAAELHHDLHTAEMPGEEEFDDFVLHVDGYLCEIKDVQIRDGLHVLGAAPEGEARTNLVLAVLRAAQVWANQAGALPGLRAAIAACFGLDEKALLAEPGAPVDVPAALTELVDGPSRSGSDAIDLLDALARRAVERMDALGWVADKAGTVLAEVIGRPAPDAERVLAFAAEEVVPRLAATSGEIDAVLHALDGGHVPAGPSGSPTRGLVNVLPTGRNFYSVDPKAVPSRNAWEVGQALADSLVRRHLDDTGKYPRSVGLTVWGTAAMRTQGDDVAEVLALLGVRPTWDDASRRVTGFEIVPPAELGRPRIDVTVRISGFFRDAFPHVIKLLDDAVAAVAELDEPPEANYPRAHALADHAGHGDWRRATTRIFGSKPGAYGAGLLPLIDARNWRDDADLAEVYAVWGGYAYGRGLDGREARADMEASFRRIAVAAKNQDTREHDIVDSDDYFQYHGGMVAMVRRLTGANPAAYVGDSALPDQVRTRTLAEETRRVFRARVVNPRWIAAMRRHGYKGAFELAATVDYLFGYDATAGVVDDWMYARLAESYVFDPENREFLERSNPWALRGITERLLEAADRELWQQPDPATLDRLRETYLRLEGDLEDGD
ncbi:cobaltochelatase subunit CobN [Marinitenerispora sediminis]|uniref:Cobaltochelatase subunit CobN n=1 Tax=Marinitenerispora sediminis TaxID=1931232 RepID=A0A368T7Q6_9ACTN|nr:cobaltochelatase subunit CobN [Marinitenerispora sediminis]RCV56408.1 cobaltochelatase subunit CobN [Marinitenerispora sediminis]RCV59752.1 cobaltochelatase subunit CobN [Marinitenerispora sediminis]